MKKFFYLFAMVALLATSACTKDDDVDTNVEFKDVTIKVGEAYTIPNGENVTWSASNTLVVSVTGNVVTGECAGVTTLSSNLGSFEVTVVPSNDKFQEPILTWGLSKNGVKDAMTKNYTAFALDSEDDTNLTYVGAGIVTMYNYDFGPTLNGSGMLVNADIIDAEEMADYMSQRYIVTEVDDEDGTVYFASTDQKTGASVSADNIAGGVYWIVYYIPLTSTKAGDIKSAFEGKVKVSNSNKDYYNKLKSALVK